MEEERVVLHVLEHFDTQDSVELGSTLGELVRLDISCEDVEVVETSLLGCSVNVDLLRLAIGEGVNATLWVLLCEVER